MAPSPYLLHVNSRPTSVSNALWKEWYKEEHLPDLQGAKVSDRATFYEEIGDPFNPHPNHPRKFLALYQTSLEESLKSAAYQGIRNTSELFGKEGARSNKIQGQYSEDMLFGEQSVFVRSNLGSTANSTLSMSRSW